MILQSRLTFVTRAAYFLRLLADPHREVKRHTAAVVRQHARARRRRTTEEMGLVTEASNYVVPHLFPCVFLPVFLPLFLCDSF